MTFLGTRLCILWTYQIEKEGFRIDDLLCMHYRMFYGSMAAGCGPANLRGMLSHCSPWNGVQSKPPKSAASANEISWVKCLFIRNLKTEMMGTEVQKCLNTNSTNHSQVKCNK